MAPAVPESAWRKSSQWVALTRPHAMRAVEDAAVNGAIQRHCRYGYDSYLRRCAPACMPCAWAPSGSHKPEFGCEKMRI